MFNRRKQLIQEIAAMNQRLHCQQSEVTARKTEIIATLYHHYYLFLIGVLTLAFVFGWKMGKDLSITQITTQMFNSGLLFLISQYQPITE